MSKQIAFKKRAGSIDDGYYLALGPKQEGTVILKPKQIEKFNNKGWSIFLPASRINKSKLRIKNMVWKFTFKNKEEKNSIKGDIHSKNFWMEQFKNNKKIKESFKKALGRKRGRYKQLAVIISDLNIYVILTLQGNLQYLKREIFENYWQSVQNELQISFKTKTGKEFIIKPDQVKKDEVFSTPLGLGIPVPDYKYGDSREKTVIAKSPSASLTKKSFYRAYETKNGKHIKKRVNKNSKPLNFKVKDEYNCYRDRQKILAGQEAYKAKLEKFRDKYKEQLVRNGELGVQRWLGQSISVLFNLKGFVFESYGLKNAKSIKGRVTIDKKFNSQTGKYDKTTKLFIENNGNKERITLGGMRYEKDGLKSVIDNKLITPTKLLKEFILNSKLKNWGFKKDDFLKYWESKPNQGFSLLNVWLRDGLGIRYSGKNRNTNYAEFENGELSMIEKGKKLGLAEKQGDKDELQNINEKNIFSRWSEFVDLYRGGQIAQKKFFDESGITKKDLIKLGGMKDCLIFPLDNLSEVLKGRKLKRYDRLIKAINRAGMIHKTIHREDGFRTENIKLLDFAEVGKKETLLKGVKHGTIPAPLQEKWFNDNKKYVCIKVSEDFYEKSDPWTHSVLSITSEDFLKQNATTKNLGYTLLSRAKKYQALPENGTGLGGYGYPIGSKESKTYCDLSYLKNKFGINRKTIQNSLANLKEIGVLNSYTISRKNNKVDYRISTKYLY